MSMPERKLVHADIKPENPPERTAHYLDVPNMPWEPTKFPGITIKVLYTDDSGITTALFKLEPGAVVPHVPSVTLNSNREFGVSPPYVRVQTPLPGDVSVIRSLPGSHPWNDPATCGLLIAAT